MRAASGIPRDAAFTQPRKGVPRLPYGFACHRTPKDLDIYYFVFFVDFVVPSSEVIAKFCSPITESGMRPTRIDGSRVARHLEFGGHYARNGRDS